MTTQNAGEMTVEECRAWLAERAGWTKRTRDIRRNYHVEDKEADAIEAAWVEEHGFHCVASTGGICTYWTHPTEPSVMGENPPWYPSTLDAAAAAIRKGWLVMCNREIWTAWGGSTDKIVDVPRTDDEMADRFRLAVAVEMAERSKG